MSRWLSPLMAFCLSFIIIAGFAPSLGIQIDRQIDFWLLWIGTMLILALPIAYLEIALAKRSKTTALNALSHLTRDADASSKWRIIGWMSVVFIPFLAGGVLLNIAQISLKNTTFVTQSSLVFAVLAIIAFGLSYLPRQILVILSAVAVIVSLVIANVFGAVLQPWHVTPIEFKEWGNASILALVASGLGLGLYWQTNLLQVQQQDHSSKTALPVWFAQLVAVVAFGFFAMSEQISAWSMTLAAVAAAALLLQMAREQLLQRRVAMIIQYLILLMALFIWAIPNLAQILNPLLMLWGLLICLIYSIFAGWIMKISHLRKAMNFSNELFYNVWRIAVRIVVPIAIVIAIISFIGQLL